MPYYQNIPIIQICPAMLKTEYWEKEAKGCNSQLFQKVGKYWPNYIDYCYLMFSATSQDSRDKSSQPDRSANEMHDLDTS